MRLVLLGSGEFGLPTFEWVAQHHAIAAVVTRPDRPAGRKRVLTPTPIATWARARGLEVLRPEDANEESFVRAVRDLGAEGALVIAYGQKLGPPLVQALGHWAVNLHASLLPKYRGAAPINWALMRGETETGLSVIGLAQEMDAGPVYAQVSTRIDPHETAGELHDRLAALGPGVVARVLEQLEAGTARPRAQDHAAATRAPKLSKADARICFEWEARKVQSFVHGLTPWPGVRALWQRASGGAPQVLFLRRVAAEPGPRAPVAVGQVLEGFRVAVGDGAVRLLEVQVPGGRPMPVPEFARGHQLGEADQLIGGPV